jgi:hypothetical protein
MVVGARALQTNCALASLTLFDRGAALAEIADWVFEFG